MVGGRSRRCRLDLGVPIGGNVCLRLDVLVNRAGRRGSVDGSRELGGRV